jgi:hypothetical protein
MRTVGSPAARAATVESRRCAMMMARMPMVTLSPITTSLG